MCACGVEEDEHDNIRPDYSHHHDKRLGSRWHPGPGQLEVLIYKYYADWKCPHEAGRCLPNGQPLTQQAALTGLLG